MKLHNHGSFSIFFGDKEERCIPTLYRIYTSFELGLHNPFYKIQQRLQCSRLFFLHQVHGTAGSVIDDLSIKDFRSFSRDGDYLITRNISYALGVVTADCLPIIMYDCKNNVVALVHAGWRGSVNGIVCKVLQEMDAHYGTSIHDITIFFGPSAGVCCYRVDEKFIDPLRKSQWFDQVIQQRNKEYFFDLPLYNQLVLMRQGVGIKSINRDYNDCTIHNVRYCSYRRETLVPYRNVTAVILH